MQMPKKGISRARIPISLICSRVLIVFVGGMAGFVGILREFVRSDLFDMKLENSLGYKNDFYITLNNLTMDMSSFNWWTVLVAGLSAFVVGGIWYSPGLFGNAWMKDSKLNEGEIRTSNKGKIFGFTAVFSLLMAVNLAMFLADGPADCPAGCAQKN